MRAIDADKLKEHLKKLKAKADNKKYEQGLQDAIDCYFPQIIDDAPTVDVQPDNGWISVKDRLPEPGIPVLALQFDVPHSRRTRYRLVRLVVYDTIDPSTGKKMISWFPNYGGHCVENIAYWQPLPKTPKGEE